jgi:DNA polymerase
MKRRVLSIDVETCCEADLKKVGASKYSKDPSLIVTTAAFAFDNDPVFSVINPGTGRLELPKVVVHHLVNGGKFRAWNAAFETAILSHYFDIPIKPEQVSCSMQRALHAGLPGALGDCGPALRLNIVKDNTAYRLMMQMAKPRKHRGGKISYWHIDDPEKLARLRAYCEKDVEAEREIAKYIPELPEREKRISALDRAANERGIKLDVRLIEKMITLADEATAQLNARCAIVTKGAVTSPGTQTARLSAWLGSRGLPVDSLAKGYVEDALKRVDTELANSPAAQNEKKQAVMRAVVLRRDDDSLYPILAASRIEPFADVKEALQLRQVAAKSSVKKLRAMLNCMEEHDQCVRGVLAYYGASRTGRFAGRLIQPQNYPRPSFKEINRAIELLLRVAAIKEIEAELFTPVAGGEKRTFAVLEIIASCLRGCLIPRKGKKFIDFDLSQIEARVVAWLAGQNDILEVFARGEDVYTYAAKKIGLNHRQEGKATTLGLGFGLGKHKFIDLAATYGLTYSLEQSEKIVSDWRAENAHICNLWWDTDRIVKECIRAAKSSPLGKAEREINKYLSVMVNKARNGSYLMTLLLPSGRRLYYRDVALEIERPEKEIADAERDLARGEIDVAMFADIMAELSQRRVRESITYSGVDQITKRWGKVRTYGAKIIENCTQAFARDVVIEMALTIDDQKLGELVLSVHDQLLNEVPEDEAKERYTAIEKIMNTTPAFAPGLPVAAEGHIVERFGK